MSQNLKSDQENSETPATEVLAKAQRRQYTAEYKLGVLREADACKVSGEMGALLRREGLYSSLVSRWRQQREQGRLAAGWGGSKRGPRPNPQVAEVERLEKENAQLRARLGQAELIIEVQKKVSQLLGAASEQQDREGQS